MNGPQRASALEFIDGKIQLHGVGEVQLRALARDYHANEDWDLAQF